MTSLVRSMLASGLLAVSLLCVNPSAPVWAQAVQEEPGMVQDDAFDTEDDGFDWGWIGLLGLLGLAGLMRRDRAPRENTSVRSRP